MIKLSRSELEFKKVNQLAYGFYTLMPEKIAVVGGLKNETKKSY